MGCRCSSDLVSLWLWCRPQLQLQFDPWPRNLHMLQTIKRKKIKKKKKKEDLPSVMAWMKLKTIRLCEVSQIQKDKNSMIQKLCESKIGELIKAEAEQWLSAEHSGKWKDVGQRVPSFTEAR